MTLTRPRLTAALLCLLLALTVGILLYSGGPSDRRYAYDRSAELRSFDVVSEPPPPMMAAAMPPPAVRLETASPGAGPSVSPTAAPGVAFNYRYAFRLPADRIAALQERHAALCERLTVARCRITGMHYQVVDGRGIAARLELKLDPRIARQFGRNSVDAVIQADGMLTQSDISGIDAAEAIRNAGRSLAELTGELARVEARLRAATAAERPQLDDQALQLREQIRALRGSRETQRESLATTPMLFDYASGALIDPRPAPPTTLGQATARSLDAFLDGATVLLIILVTLLPWVLTLIAGWAVWRAIRRRRLQPTPATATS